MSFGGRQVLAFESRRAKEIAELIRINGGEPFVAPAVVEVPIEDQSEALAFGERLQAGEFDMMIFLTGSGARYLQQVLGSQFVDALRGLTTVARGPKPAAVLREWKAPVTIAVPEPSTWRELLQAIEGRPEKSVALQEYGRSNPELIDGLERQGRKVTRVAVYQWRMPEDRTGLEEALAGVLAGRFEAALFTTGVQMEHFLEFAAAQGRRDVALEGLQKMFIGSIGPTCSETLRSCGVVPSMEPSHPKTGLLVREAALRYAERSH